MDTRLRTIKTLWIGSNLGVIEQLCLRSFIECGHRVEIFIYQDVMGIPDGVTIRDANDILPEREIFFYRHKKSVAGFSNWFRYKLLYLEGGIWVDMDVICLKPFEFEQPLFFGREDIYRFNNAVLGAPKGSELMKFMMDQADSPNTVLPYDTIRQRRRKFFRKYFQGNDRGNVKWGEVGPLGLTNAIRHFGLDEHALPYTAFYPIHPLCWDAIFDETYSDIEAFFPNTYAIHLWNEMMRSKMDFDKNADFPENSLIETLKRRYLK